MHGKNVPTAPQEEAPNKEGVSETYTAIEDLAKELAGLGYDMFEFPTRPTDHPTKVQYCNGIGKVVKVIDPRVIVESPNSYFNGRYMVFTDSGASVAVAFPIETIIDADGSYDVVRISDSEDGTAALISSLNAARAEQASSDHRFAHAV